MAKKGNITKQAKITSDEIQEMREDLRFINECIADKQTLSVGDLFHIRQLAAEIVEYCENAIELSEDQ